MAKLVVFIGEIPTHIEGEPVFINSWCYENVFDAGENGVAYLDAKKQVRINPRMLLQDPEAVASRVMTLGAGKWTLDHVRAALTLPLNHLLAHFDVERDAFGTIVRVAKARRARLHGDPNANYKVRIPDAGLQDLRAQNGEEAGNEARRIAERAAMVDVANVVSRVQG